MEWENRKRQVIGAVMKETHNEMRGKTGQVSPGQYSIAKHRLCRTHHQGWSLRTSQVKSTVSWTSSQCPSQLEELRSSIH